MPLDRDFLTYSAKDAHNTLQIYEEFWDGLAPTFTRAYDLTIRLFPVLMFMQSRGIVVSLKLLEETKADVIRTAADKQRELNALIGKELNVNSPKQCQEYFYNELGYGPYRNAEGRPTVDDMALQRLVRGTVGKPGLRAAKLVQDIRGLNKLYGTYLGLEFDADGRIRCSFNPRGTKFGRLSSSQTIFGTGCVMPDAEVLTPKGWVEIKDFVSGTQAMEWNANTKTLSWGTPALHKDKARGSMLTCKSEQHFGMYTPDHRIPTMGHRQNTVTEKRATDASRVGFYLPISGKYSDGTLNCANLIRVAVMVQADGSIEGANIRLAFMKSAKIERCLKLLDTMNMEYTEQKTKEGYRRFCISVKDSALIIQLLGKDKNFADWIFNLSADSLEAFIDEVQYWDAHIRGRSYQYFTVNKTNADWVATVASLTNRSATVRKNEDNNRGYGVGNNQTLYTVNIKPRNYAIISPDHWEVTGYDGDVYCLKTRTGYFLVRYNGFIAVTGNTNFQNLPQEFKKFLVPDEGFCFIEVDKRQAEWVVVAYVAGDANMIAAVEGGIDVHTYTACQMFDVPPEVVKVDHKLCGNLTDADTIKELRMSDPLLRQHYKSTWPRSMSLRQCGKKSNHGLNYDEGYRGFALINEMDEGEAKRVYTFYHNIYPGIKRWYEATKYALTKNRTLVNCFGRAVRFLGAWNDKLWKAAYSMIPQSTVVDSLNEGMVRIYEDEWLTRGLNGDILAQVHDSILMQFPIKWLEDKHHFDMLMAKVTHYTSPEMEYNGKRFKIASDYKVGLNWGGGHPEHNPQGMVDVSNHDEFMKILKGWNNVPRAEKLD